MNMLDQRISIWSGLAFVVLFGLGLLLAGFIPPPGPSMGPEEVAAMYRESPERIRLGMFVIMLSLAFYPPFVVVISTQMRRMQGISKLLIDLQLGAGVIGTLVLVFPVIIFAVAAFRPERDSQATVVLNDIAWLLFITPFPTFLSQYAAIAFATLTDKSAVPVFPRWAAYFNLWAAVLFVPGGLAFFFKTGPFAWNGLLAFWVPAMVFFGWLLVMMVVLLKAIAQIDSRASLLETHVGDGAQSLTGQAGI